MPSNPHSFTFTIIILFVSLICSSLSLPLSPYLPYQPLYADLNYIILCVLYLKSHTSHTHTTTTICRQRRQTTNGGELYKLTYKMNDGIGTCASIGRGRREGQEREGRKHLTHTHANDEDLEHLLIRSRASASRQCMRYRYTYR